MAIGSKAWQPRVDSPALRFVRFSAPTLEAGMDEYTIEVFMFAFTTPPRESRIVKYHNKIGLDVALEALRGCRRQRMYTNDGLWRYVMICRVANVMQPYMGAVELTRNSPPISQLSSQARMSEIPP